MDKYRKEYVLKIAKEGNPDGYDGEEIDILAKRYANFEVKREQKHLKAYLKGKKFYKVYGRTYPVLTPQVIEQQKHMALQAEPNEEEE